MAIEIEPDGRVAVVTISNPGRKNALTAQMREDLLVAFRNFADDDSVRAVVLTGAGDAFCSGADIAAMDRPDIPVLRGRMKTMHAMVRAIHDLDKPVIAAVRGVAVGLGWSLALACDVVMAAESAKFGQVFKRVGLAPDGGAVWFLTRQIGFSRAKELVYSARMLPAQEALALGLAQRVVADADLLLQAMELAREYAAGPTFALGMAKRMFAGAVSPTLEQFLETELLVQPQLRLSRDHEEGSAAFREKRPPVFTGR